MTGRPLGTGSRGAVAFGSTASARTTSMGSVVTRSNRAADPRGSVSCERGGPSKPCGRLTLAPPSPALPPERREQLGHDPVDVTAAERDHEVTRARDARRVVRGRLPVGEEGDV